MLFFFFFYVICEINIFFYLLNFIGILPKRKDGSENILTKIQSVIDGFDSKSNDKGIILIKFM